MYLMTPPPRPAVSRAAAAAGRSTQSLASLLRAASPMATANVGLRHASKHGPQTAPPVPTHTATGASGEIRRGRARFTQTLRCARSGGANARLASPTPPARRYLERIFPSTPRRPEPGLGRGRAPPSRTPLLFPAGRAMSKWGTPPRLLRLRRLRLRLRAPPCRRRPPRVRRPFSCVHSPLTRPLSRRQDTARPVPLLHSPQPFPTHLKPQVLGQPAKQGAAAFLPSPSVPSSLSSRRVALATSAPGPATTTTTTTTLAPVLSAPPTSTSPASCSAPSTPALLPTSAPQPLLVLAALLVFVQLDDARELLPASHAKGGDAVQPLRLPMALASAVPQQAVRRLKLNLADTAVVWPMRGPLVGRRRCLLHLLKVFPAAFVVAKLGLRCKRLLTRATPPIMP